MSRVGGFKQLCSQRNHVCNSRVRSPSTGGFALPQHSSLLVCPPVWTSSPLNSWEHILRCHELTIFHQFLQEFFVILRFYVFILTMPGVYVNGKWNSCFSFCDIFVLNLKFPKRALTLPGPQAQPNPTADDIYLMA